MQMHTWTRFGMCATSAPWPQKWNQNVHWHLLLHDSVTQNTYDFWLQFWGQFSVYLALLGLASFSLAKSMARGVRAGEGGPRARADCDRH